MVGDLGPGVEDADQRRRERDAADGGDHPDDDGEPDAVDTLGEGGPEVARAEVAGDAGGGAVGEEDAQPDDRLEDDRGDAEARELGRAEVADDGGVGEQEERFGDEREEGRDGQAQDLAVCLPVVGLHRFTLGTPQSSSIAGRHSDGCASTYIARWDYLCMAVWMTRRERRSRQERRRAAGIRQMADR